MLNRNMETEAYRDKWRTGAHNPIKNRGGDRTECSSYRDTVQ